MRMPKGYRGVVLGALGDSGPLRLAVLVSERADPVGGNLVLLREHFDARVWLGAMIDAAGEVHQWCEIWSQRTEGVRRSLSGARGVTNHDLDRRWEAIARAFQASEPEGLIWTGYESRPGPIVAIDSASLEAIEPTESGSGAHWVLCTDDAFLRAKGLGSYGTSNERYWWVPELGESGPLAVVDEGAGDAPVGMVRASDVIGAGRALVLGGGRVMVRMYRAATYGEVVECLTTGAWNADDGGALGGRVPLGFDGLALGSGIARSGKVADESLVLSRRGVAGVQVETLHLKLRLLASAIGVVRSVEERTAVPMLNVREETFRVSLAAKSPGLPRWWTAGVSLAEPGDAIELAIGDGASRYFVPANPGLGGIYRPAAIGGGGCVRGTVRLREVRVDTDKSVHAEATLALPSVASIGRSDLVFIRMAAGGKRMDVTGSAERTSAMAAGEWRFRSEKLVMDGERAGALKGLEGVPIPDVEIEIVPLVSSPADLYGLAVLGARTLLLNGESTLAVVIDELMSLAREAAGLADGSSTLAARIQHLANQDRRWGENLGPHRLTSAGLSAEQAFAILPAELWWDVIGVLVKMLPGMGPDSVCSDLGDAPTSSPHAIFDPILAEFERLLTRTRSLVVIDWSQNREVHGVVRGFLLKYDQEGRG